MFVNAPTVNVSADLSDRESEIIQFSRKLKEDFGVVIDRYLPPQEGEAQETHFTFERVAGKHGSVTYERVAELASIHFGAAAKRDHAVVGGGVFHPKTGVTGGPNSVLLPRDP